MSTQTERLNAALSGRYRIERELGAGGMATVYLAEDLKHDRKVAIKVLKPELAAVLGAERFVVEIKTTAAMSHPHILPLFDSGTADGFLFYVMPYIQGETIREKLNRETQFGVDEAVRIAREVADALDYAHRHGVIHRDIKPENILLHDGRAMVMDFGIALAVSAAAGGRMTETGLSLGTPHYMSPEQATAEKEITARSDQYSLASVLYEMLTGNAPFTGAAAQQIIMKIITEPAEPVTKYRKSVPPNVVAVVAKALEKLPADRFESAKAFADALQNVAFALPASAGGLDAAGGGRWKQRAAIPLAAALVLAVGIAAWGWTRREPAQPVLRFDLSLGTLTPAPNSDVVISPDGSMLAVVAGTASDAAIYLRRLDGDPDFRKVAGTEGTAGSPTFSPDNQWLAFRRSGDGALVKVPVAGGGSTTITRLSAGEIGDYLHWGTDDQIVYSRGPVGLFKVAAVGGAPVHLAKTEGAARYSYLLPDGSGVLFSRNGGAAVLTFATDSVTSLIPGVHPTYVSTGHLLYTADGGGLFAAPFDPASHQLVGTPVRVLDGVAAAIGQRGYSVSSNGVLVLHQGASTVTGDGSPTRFLVLNAAGGADTVRLPVGRRLDPSFSPDGRSIAYEYAGPARSGATDIHTFDLISGTETRITFDKDNDDPVWSPDGKRIAFTRQNGSAAGDIFVKQADNSGAEQLLLSLPGNQNPVAWLDNDTILFISTQAGQLDLFTLSLKGGATPKAYLEAPWAEQEASVSRDGKLAAFVSNEVGGFNVWIRDFPVAEGKWQVSPSGGRAPRWSPDGRYVYFWKPASPLDSLFRARIDRTPAVVVRAPELVLALDISGIENWDIHPDGKRFMVTINDVAPQPVSGAAGSAGAAPVSRYIVVQNWFTELKAKMGKGKQ